MLNILGRTKEEQDSIDRELKERGNLWGKIGILYDYKYREEEIKEVNKSIDRKLLEVEEDYKRIWGCGAIGSANPLQG